MGTGQKSKRTMPGREAEVAARQQRRAERIIGEAGGGAVDQPGYRETQDPLSSKYVGDVSPGTAAYAARQAAGWTGYTKTGALIASDFSEVPESQRPTYTTTSEEYTGGQLKQRTVTREPSGWETGKETITVRRGTTTAGIPEIPVTVGMRRGGAPAPEEVTTRTPIPGSSPFYPTEEEWTGMTREERIQIRQAQQYREVQPLIEVQKQMAREGREEITPAEEARLKRQGFVFTPIEKGFEITSPKSERLSYEIKLRAKAIRETRPATEENWFGWVSPTKEQKKYELAPPYGGRKTTAEKIGEGGSVPILGEFQKTRKFKRWYEEAMSTVGFSIPLPEAWKQREFNLPYLTTYQGKGVKLGRFEIIPPGTRFGVGYGGGAKGSLGAVEQGVKDWTEGMLPTTRGRAVILGAEFATAAVMPYVGSAAKWVFEKIPYAAKIAGAAPAEMPWLNLGNVAKVGAGSYLVGKYFVVPRAQEYIRAPSPREKGKVLGRTSADVFAFMLGAKAPLYLRGKYLVIKSKLKGEYGGHIPAEDIAELQTKYTTAPRIHTAQEIKESFLYGELTPPPAKGTPGLVKRLPGEKYLIDKIYGGEPAWADTLPPKITYSWRKINHVSPADFIAKGGEPAWNQIAFEPIKITYTWRNIKSIKGWGVNVPSYVKPLSVSEIPVAQQYLPTYEYSDYFAFPPTTTGDFKPTLEYSPWIDFSQARGGVYGWHATPTTWDTITYATAGTSELPGIYFAPRLQSHFLKLSPAYDFGFDIPLAQSPSAVRYKGFGIEVMPITGTNIPTQTEFLFNKAEFNWLYSPLMKREYEAIIAPGTMVGRYGKTYFTKIKGIDIPIYQYKPLEEFGIKPFYASPGSLTAKIIGHSGYVSPSETQKIARFVVRESPSKFSKYFQEIFPGTTGIKTELLKIAGISPIPEGTSSAIFTPYQIIPISVSYPSYAPKKYYSITVPKSSGYAKSRAAPSPYYPVGYSYTGTSYTSGGYRAPRYSYVSYGGEGYYAPPSEVYYPPSPYYGGYGGYSGASPYRYPKYEEPTEGIFIPDWERKPRKAPKPFKVFKLPKMEYGYQPSFTSMFFGITASKIPQPAFAKAGVFSPFQLRPLIRGYKPKKKKKREKKFSIEQIKLFEL